MAKIKVPTFDVKKKRVTRKQWEEKLANMKADRNVWKDQAKVARLENDDLKRKMVEYPPLDAAAKSFEGQFNVLAEAHDALKEKHEGVNNRLKGVCGHNKKLQEENDRLTKQAATSDKEYNDQASEIRAKDRMIDSEIVMLNNARLALSSIISGAEAARNLLTECSNNLHTNQ